MTLVLTSFLTKATNPQEDSEADIEGQRLQRQSEMQNTHETPTKFCKQDGTIHTVCQFEDEDAVDDLGHVASFQVFHLNSVNGSEPK